MENAGPATKNTPRRNARTQVASGFLEKKSSGSRHFGQSVWFFFVKSEVHFHDASIGNRRSCKMAQKSYLPNQLRVDKTFYRMLGR